MYDVSSSLNVFKLAKICNDLNMSIIVVYFILSAKSRHLIIKNVPAYTLIAVQSEGLPGRLGRTPQVY